MNRTDQDMPRGPLAWMASHPVAANLLMIVFLVGGLIMSSRIKQEVFPDFELDTVTVSVAYPGASPEEVEQGIILSIEDAIQGLEGVKEVTSRAGEGSGTVTIELIEGEDIQRLAQDIQNEVDRISTFPDDAEDPKVVIADAQRRVVTLVVYGPQTESVLRESVEIIRDDLIQDPEITFVELDSVRDLEIVVEVPQDNLRRYGLTIEDVAVALSRSAREIPGGSLKTDSGEILVRMQERRDAATEFGSIPVLVTSQGAEVLLEDIAVVREGFEDVDLYATFDGQRSMEIDVYRVGDQTPTSVSQAVRRHVERLQKTLPEGVNIALRSDRSDVFKQRLDLLVRNGLMGLLLVFGLLAVFLETRLAFWVSLGIPISFLGSFLLLPSMDVSVNMVSLFAFIVTLGIVVDDAIVVGENVYSFRRQGFGPMASAIAGARQVAMPVTFSVMTNILAFLPMFFVPGIMGKIFAHIPAVVAAVFAVSLVESLLILPAHLGHSRETHHKGFLGGLHALQQKFSSWFEHVINDYYGPFLRRVLRFRYITMAVAVSILTISLAFIMSGRMGMTMFPRVESDFSQAELVLPYGTPVTRTEALTAKIVEEAGRVIAENGGEKLSRGVYAQLGRSGSHTSIVRVYLSEPDVRPVTTGEFTKKWRERVGTIAGTESLRFRADARGPGSGDALSVELSHRDMDVLEQASSELAAVLEGYPNVSDVDDGFAPGKRQLDFHMEPEGRNYGLRSLEVARQVRHALHGVEALKQQRGRNEVTVRVRLPEEERMSEYDLESFILQTPNGSEIPLVDAVSIEPGRAYTSIDRRNGRRVVTVNADVNPADQAGQIIRDLEASALPALVKKYPGLSYSFEGKQADIKESLTSLAQGLAMALLGIYAMLAIPFRSYWQPLIIMTSIPFGLVGAVAGHLIMGYSLSILSMFGMLALSGVVVNDSLVLVDFANRARRSGAGMTDAIHGAAVQRFRPIMLTTLTTFGGLAPMIMETSVQARFLIPMAISLGFGILFATAIILLIVPCLYMIIEDIGRLRHC